MRKHIEKIWPIILATVCTLVIRICQQKKIDTHVLIMQISKAAQNINITLLGFLITVLTLLHTISTRRMNFVRDSGAYPRVQQFLKVSIRLNILSLLATFGMTYIEANSEKGINRDVIEYIFIFIFTWSFWATIRFIEVFMMLMAENTEDQGGLQ